MVACPNALVRVTGFIYKYHGPVRVYVGTTLSDGDVCHAGGRGQKTIEPRRG